MTKKLFFIFILTSITSCKTSVSLAEMPNHFSNQKKMNTPILKDKVQNIESYISHIDHNSNDKSNFTTDNLKINGSKRIITENESTKKVILKNKEIVKVKYLEHLKNNFIKSKEFYYNNNSLVCIKLTQILPNKHNQSVLYQRVIYIDDEKLISDSDASNSNISSNDLVTLGVNYLKKEYNNFL